MKLSHYENPPCVRLERKLRVHRLIFATLVSLYVTAIMLRLLHF